MHDLLAQFSAEVIPARDLRLSRAQRTVELFSAQPSPSFMRLVECRRSDQKGLEFVVMDLDVSVSQRPIHDIRRVERIAAVFSGEDTCPPEVLALRRDFPIVPHLNIRPFELPRSLCLSDQPFEEEKIRWTARSFVERIRSWLALTAQGELHQDDQPLEPLLAGVTTRIILPGDLFRRAGEGLEHLYVNAIGRPGPDMVLRADRKQRDADGKPTLEFVALPIESAPHTHGVIRWQPRNLKELHQFLSAVGTDLIAELRTRLRSWEAERSYLGARLILIISLPKRRSDAGQVEDRETWGFITAATIEEVGNAIDAWELYKGHRGIVLQIDAEKQGEGIGLDLLIPNFTLSRSDAASLNGLAERSNSRITAIGAGALGSQVIKNLVREGYGEWTIVDDDPLLPHNLARHALNGAALGFSKAHAVAMDANGLLEGEPIANSITANVLQPKDSVDTLSQAFSGADVILDLAASVAVARHVAHLDVNGRRVSAFLSPSGSDLVVLVEDTQRTVRLDSLEMQYYRYLTTREELSGHFWMPDGKIRYGHSCRDVTSRISQELVSLHSGIASRAIRRALEKAEASITIWAADEDLGVQRFHSEPVPMCERQFGSWTLCTDQCLLDKITRLREGKLPRETGGVLLGSFDMDRRIVYVVDSIPSPPDSLEQPTVYIRGSQGLKQDVERVHQLTGGWLEYVGEWHSHPPGSSAGASGDDRKLFAWLQEMMSLDGHPATMLIAAETELRWYVESIITK